MRNTSVYSIIYTFIIYSQLSFIRIVNCCQNCQNCHCQNCQNCHSNRELQYFLAMWLWCILMKDFNHIFEVERHDDGTCSITYFNSTSREFHDSQAKGKVISRVLHLYFTFSLFANTLISKISKLLPQVYIYIYIYIYNVTWIIVIAES